MASQAQYNGNIASMETYNTAASRSKRMAYGFRYDASERLTGAGNHAYNAETQRYDATNEWEMPLLNYDAAGNLKLLQRTDSKGDLVDDFRYLYQSGTNRLSEIENRASEEVLSYMYDANGNVIRDLSRNLSWVEYDLHNQPISDYNIKDGSGTLYAYGVNGERIRKYSTKRNDTYYVPGADGRTEVILNHPYAKDVTINLWGNDNLGQIRVGPGNKEYRYYYLKDHLGSIRATVDESGTVTSGDDYYPFGMAMDSRTTASGKVDTKLKFTGKERDVETGYDYFGARYYDARIGRFLQRDHEAERGPGVSPYAYSFNNPIKNIDPDGKWPGSIHNQLIATAFNGDNKAIKVYQDASAWADAGKHQDTENSFMHGMRDYRLSEEKGNEKITDYLNNPYPDAAAAGQDEFGVKLHVIMDMTSYSHQGTQEWGRPLSDGLIQLPDVGAVGAHWAKEQFITVRRFFATVRLMRQYKEDNLAKKKVDIKQYAKLFQQYMEEESDEERAYNERQQQEQTQQEADRR